ncbi:hypothetical protein HPB47_012388 [Ixodes persulcatus]|uniref:Uncharacterized protein n=1 Tax=Ixodes persulcatus TaxID=34615 RepID=A0AC60NTP6_IXOPE|nr:hypothetical protein HPB47_012388 [Ixodes persulcatus]
MMHTNNEDPLTTLKPELYVASNQKQWSANLMTLESFQKSFGRDEKGDQQYLDLGWPAGCLPCRRIVAVDIFRDMVEYAMGHFAHPKIKYEVLDVVADDVSGFVKRYGQFDRALKNIALLMKPGGSCLLLFCATTPLMRLPPGTGSDEALGEIRAAERCATACFVQQAAASCRKDAVPH